MTRDEALRILGDIEKGLRRRANDNDAEALYAIGKWLKAENATPGTAWGCEAGWQPIESAPKDGTQILLLDEDGTVCEAFWDTLWNQAHPDGGGVWNFNTMPADWPTHWMPLPPPPVTDKGADATTESPPAKATTEEDPVTDKAERKCSHCDWGQFSRPCKQCPNPDEFHRYRNEQITASRNKKETR